MKKGDTCNQIEVLTNQEIPKCKGFKQYFHPFQLHNKFGCLYLVAGCCMFNWKKIEETE